MSKESNLSIDFENQDVFTKEVNGDILFELYSVGASLGYTRIATAKGKKYPQIRKDRVDKIVNGNNIKIYTMDNDKYIDAKGLRKIISSSHTAKKYSFIQRLAERGFVEYNEVFTSTRKEIEFLNELEQVLSPMGISGVRQYAVSHYRIDFYIPQYNLAVEYDENSHQNYSAIDEEIRQNTIEDVLGCSFVRVSDSKNNLYNIGKVINAIIAKKGEQERHSEN